MRQRQFKISLDPELRAMIDGAAAFTGRSTAEEIRARLARTFRDDGPRDPDIRALAKDVAELVEKLLSLSWWQPERAAWKNDHRIHEAIKIAIAQWFDNTKPEPKNISAAADDLFDPRTLGMAAAKAFELQKRDEALKRQAVERVRQSALKEAENAEREFQRLMKKTHKEIEKNGGEK